MRASLSLPSLARAEQRGDLLSNRTRAPTVVQGLWALWTLALCCAFRRLLRIIALHREIEQIGEGAAVEEELN